MFPIFISSIDNSADREFAEILYIEFKDKVYNTIYNILKDEQDAEEATGDTFIKVIDKIKDYRNKSEYELGGLLVTIAKNSAIDKLRKKNKIKFTPISEAENISADSDDVEDFIVKQEFFEKLYEAIEMLDEEYKQILKLKLLYGYNDKEISGILSISNENVRVRFHRAKKILSEYLKEANLYGEE